MDGRDIGSVVFPDAELKIFMTADPEIRAERRYQEMIIKGSEESYDQILENLKKRDHIDSSREDSPLIQVADAHIIDTSNLSRQQQLDQAMKLALSVIS
jgi:cytidylate kinase